MLTKQIITLTYIRTPCFILATNFEPFLLKSHSYPAGMVSFQITVVNIPTYYPNNPETGNLKLLFWVVLPAARRWCV